MANMTSIIRKGVIALAVALLATGAAMAHPHLVSAAPAAGAVVKGSPRQIQMSFSEGIIARFTGITLTDARGAVIQTGPGSVVGSTKLVVPVTAMLKPGRYKVTWHAVSEDTHRVAGSFSFTVGR